MAAAGFFCLMCGYYTLRPMREALALEVGVQYNSILFSTVLVCSAALLPIYWWLVARTPRGRLPWLVSTPFVVVFLALAAGLTLVSGQSHRGLRVFRRADLGQPVPDLDLLERDGGRVAA